MPLVQPSTVRAKFKVASIEGGAQKTIALHAVYGGSAENERFFAYTPSGEIRLGLVNESAASQFELGQEYYVDFTRAAPTQAN